MAAFETYEINTEQEFKAVGHVINDAYSVPFCSFWELVKGSSEDEWLSRLWRRHKAVPWSQWIGVCRKDGDQATVGLTEWLIFKSNPYEAKTSALPVDWWSDIYTRDVTEQVLNIFFGHFPKFMSRPHIYLRFCCVLPNARRHGAGRLMMNWGRDLADRLEMETFLIATFDGIRLYESVGFTQIDPLVLDASMPEHLGDDDKAAWLDARNRVLPTPYPVMTMWRPKGADWKCGDDFPVEKSTVGTH